MRNISLCNIKKGERISIKNINVSGDLRRRLFDLGFVPGTAVECVLINPFGDPRAYRVRGAVIALRNCDAAKITGVKLS
jgi:ferrous iron transport protein A